MMQGGRRKMAKGFDFATVAVQEDIGELTWPRVAHAKPNQEGAGSADDSSGFRPAT
jgi:hypothetical protein